MRNKHELCCCWSSRFYLKDRKYEQYAKQKFFGWWCWCWCRGRSLHPKNFPTHPMTPPPGGWNPWEIRRNSWNPNVEILKYETHQTLPLTTLHSAQLHALYTESLEAWFLKILWEPASLQTWYQIIARGNIRLHFFIEKIGLQSFHWASDPVAIQHRHTV